MAQVALFLGNVASKEPHRAGRLIQRFSEESFPAGGQ